MSCMLDFVHFKKDYFDVNDVFLNPLLIAFYPSLLYSYSHYQRTTQ